jgi:uncharacterized protein YhfF|tara:strand:- start:63 stop:560 length:498 start_codon:yes stop_codon:yes gene_type:complete
MDDAMSTPLEPATEAFWRQYLDAAPDATAAQRWFYESFLIGTSVESGNEGALLISRGIKTTTSSLLWEYEAEHKPLPQVGSLSILKDGHEQAVCVVETTELVTRAFRDVDARFAYDYGEWDRTLKTWRHECWRFYAAQCETLGREPAPTMPLVCERFRVVYGGKS